MVERFSAGVASFLAVTYLALVFIGCGGVAPGDPLTPGTGGDDTIVGGVVVDADPNDPNQQADPNTAGDPNDPAGGDEGGDVIIDGEEPQDPNDDPGPAAIRFTVSVQEGARPLEVTCAATTSGQLPDGVYHWFVDGVVDSGSRQTHATHAATFDRCGAHTVRLSYAPAPGEPFEPCQHVASGSESATVVVWPCISGKLTRPEGEPIAGVVIQTSDGLAESTTGADGSFHVDVPMGWSGQIVPSSQDYEFDRLSRTYTQVNADVSDQDFVGLPQWMVVSGAVTDIEGDPVAALQVRAVPGGWTTTTDAAGTYELRVPYLWSGEIAPIPADYGFDPPRREYALVDEAMPSHDFVATPWPTDGSFSAEHALAMLKSLPSYTTGPRIQFMKNYSYWGDEDGGRPIMDELVRIGGAFEVDLSYIHLYGADGAAVTMAKTYHEQGARIWLVMGSISGLGFYETIEAFDPNCLHACPQPLDDYFDPEHPVSDLARSRRMFCPARQASQRQIARWFQAGQQLRTTALTPAMIEGVWIHDECARCATTSEWTVSNAMYDECTACGSVLNHNQYLAELQANIVHAMLRGFGAAPAGDLNRDYVFDAQDEAIFQQAILDQHPIGDFNNDGSVSQADWTYLQSLDPATPRTLSQFWWSGGYCGYTNDALPMRPSSWIPILDIPGLPLQTYINFSYYQTDENCVEMMGGLIDSNVDAFGKPVVPHLSLTYDGTTKAETGVPYAVNYGKAKLAAQKGCPMILCYALNPPTLGWMTPQLFRNQFESVRAIAEGSRDGVSSQP